MSDNRRRSSLSAGEKLMFLAGILFCLILITMSMMGSLFARYVGNGKADDAARVAAFDVSAAMLPVPDAGSELHQVDVVCETTAQQDGIFTITVTNNSEVAVTYDIVIRFDEELPAGVSLSLDGTKKELAADHSVTFEKVGTLPAGKLQANDHSLAFTIVWAESHLVGRNQQQKETTLGLDFTVDVTVVQVD